MERTIAISAKKVRPVGRTDIRDIFLNPYYGWAVETLVEAIIPDVE